MNSTLPVARCKMHQRSEQRYVTQDSHDLVNSIHAGSDQPDQNSRIRIWCRAYDSLYAFGNSVAQRRSARRFPEASSVYGRSFFLLVYCCPNRGYENCIRGMSLPRIDNKGRNTTRCRAHTRMCALESAADANLNRGIPESRYNTATAAA